MPNALVSQLALVSESDRVDFDELMVVAAALQKQVARDLSQSWNVNATVSAAPSLEATPLDYWPMIVMDNIGYAAAGIHLDNDGQPFALISASDDNDIWSLTASHECLEMLVDPLGDRLVAGDSPHPDQGRVLFLVEVCDPSEATEFGYTVNGVLVSDFYTPRFFDPFAASGVRYSFTDAVTEPREVLRGGYLSWLEPESGHWWQEIWFSGNQSRFRDLGPLTTQNGSIRSQIDALTGEETQRALATSRSETVVAGLPRDRSNAPADARASALRDLIGEICGSGSTTQSSSSRRRSPGRRRRPNRRPGRSGD